MSNTSTKFYHFITYASLILCCLLSFFYSFIFSVVRDKDIQDYKVSESTFITNIHHAVELFLNSYMTNSVLFPNQEIKKNDNKFPTVKGVAFGYFQTIQGNSVAVFPDGSELYEGDFYDFGRVLRITERAIYLQDFQGEYTILRRINHVPKEKTSAKIQKPSLSEGSESAEDNLENDSVL